MLSCRYCCCYSNYDCYLIIVIIIIIIFYCSCCHCHCQCNTAYFSKKSAIQLKLKHEPYVLVLAHTADARYIYCWPNNKVDN